MLRNITLPVVAVAFLAAPALAPAGILGLADSAFAAANLNSSKSNTYRTKQPPNAAKAATTNTSKSNNLGTGGAKPGTGKATNLNSSRSN
jgi:hypothetical protein